MQVKALFSKIKFNIKGILFLLFGYIIAQFLWWEVLLVRLNTQLINEKQKLLELSVADAASLSAQINALHDQKIKKILMISGEGTIFLLLLLYGISHIRKAQKKEAQLLAQKNNFLLSITHELKTPLATTKLQLQTLKKHQLPPEKQLELINIAISENERLNVLIDNVLLATKMQQNEYVISKELVNVSEFVQQLIERTYRTELSKGYIQLDIQPNVILGIDKIAFPSILINLVDNALKYSGEVISIKVKVAKVNGYVSIEVYDTGIGITDSEKGEIFNQFYRSGNEEVRRTKGTGLGLYIVKYLVEKHQGKIKVEDNVPSGSIFKIIFETA